MAADGRSCESVVPRARLFCTRFPRTVRSAMLFTPCGLTFNVPNVGKLKHEYEEHRVAETEGDTRAVRIYMLVPILCYVLGKAIGKIFADDVELWTSAGLVVWYLLVTRGPSRFHNIHGWAMLLFITLTCVISVPIATVYASDGRTCDDLPGVWPLRHLCRPSGLFACRLKNNAYPSSYFLILGIVNFSIRHLGSVGYRLHAVMHTAQFVLLSTAALMVSTRAGTHPSSHRHPFMLQWIFMDFTTCTGFLWLFEREGRVAFLQLVARGHAVQQEKMLAALLCHEIKNPLTTISYFINSVCEPHLLPVTNGDASAGATKTPTGRPDETVAGKADGGVIQVDSGNKQGAASAATAVSLLLPDAVESVAVLDKLVEDCRHLARFQSGTYKLRRDKVNLRRVVESCVGTHAREREAGLKIEFAMPQDLTVLSDRLLWQHVFATLVGNAVKYSVFQAQNTDQQSGKTLETPPRVSVRVEQDDAGNVHVQVSDTGPGISQAQQAFIVGKLAKARDRELENSLGSGLGLHLSAKIIQLLGGQLELTSPLFSGMRGTRVNFSVPCATAEGAVEVASETHANRSDPLQVTTVAASNEVPLTTSDHTHRVFSTIHCLVVEDDDVNFLILKTALTTGFQEIHEVAVSAKQARTAEDALAVIGEGVISQFDVIITDEHLECAGGQMTGSALIEILCSRQWRRRRPVLIAATGNTGDSDIERYMACGAATVWPKPYPHMKQLVSDVMQHLNTPQAALDIENACTSPEVTPPGKFATTSKQSAVNAPARQDTEEEDGMEMFGILPKVPERAFRIARRQRAILDANVLRFFFIAEFLTQFVAHEWWRILPHYEEQAPPEWEWWSWQVMRIAQLYLVWKPSRWSILFISTKAALFIALVSRLASASSGACTPDHWSNPKGYNHVCRLAELGYVDTIALSTYYVVNTIVFIWGGFRLYTQLYTMVVEVLLIVITSFFTSNEHIMPRPSCMSHRVHRISFMISTGLCLCAILVAIERKMRMHFVENRAKQRLIDQQKNLVALLCREIRNPLRVVSALLRKMNTAAVRHPRFEMLPDALNCTTLLFDIIENCQHLSKIESGQFTPQNDRMNLRELVVSCIGMHSREREAGLSFEVKCLPHLNIVSDRRLWLHILMNLIGNAVKFTMGEEDVAHKMASQVSVAIEQVGKDLHVSVSDTGPGIAKHEQALIYDKFTTGGRGFRAKGHGSGLGLHLSAKFVHILCGKLALTSPLQNGRGARFEFTVPNAFVDANAPVPLTPEHIESDVPSKPDALRVLSVEDDDLSYLLLQASLQTGLLQNAGVKVKTTRVRNAEEALNLLGSDNFCPFDVVVTDQHLEPAGGVLTGSEFTRLLQRREWQGTWRGATFRPVLAIASGDTEIVRMGSARDLHAQIIVWQKPYPSTTQMAQDIISRLPSSVVEDLSIRVGNGDNVNVRIDGSDNDEDNALAQDESDTNNNAADHNADTDTGTCTATATPTSAVVKSSRVVPTAYK